MGTRKNQKDMSVAEWQAFISTIRATHGTATDTDLHPSFSHSIISTIRSHVICYFTDGYGQVPELPLMFLLFGLLLKVVTNPHYGSKVSILKALDS